MAKTSKWVLVGKKPIGKITDTGKTFEKWVGNRHFCQALQGWGIQNIALEQLPATVKLIRVVNKESKRLYEVARDTFEDVGVVRDLGWGPQTFLPVQYWTIAKMSA